jgi:hypothetical protein
VKSVRDTVTQKASMTELNEDILKGKLDIEIKSIEAQKQVIQKELEQRQTEKKKLEGPTYGNWKWQNARRFSCKQIHR